MLFDADAEYCADTLEDIYDEIEHRQQARCSTGNVTRTTWLSDALSAIARHEDMSWTDSSQRDGHAPRGQLHDAQPAC